MSSLEDMMDIPVIFSLFSVLFISVRYLPNKAFEICYPYIFIDMEEETVNKNDLIA